MIMLLRAHVKGKFDPHYEGSVAPNKVPHFECNSSCSEGDKRYIIHMNNDVRKMSI